MTPKQRGGGSPKTGNTSHGHRSNRINSINRGGNPHAGGGGGGKGGGGICRRSVLTAVAAMTAAWTFGFTITAILHN